MPNIVVSLFFGVLVDRFSPWPMLITADLARLVLLGALPVLYGLHVRNRVTGQRTVEGAWM